MELRGATKVPNYLTSDTPAEVPNLAAQELAGLTY